MTTSCQRLVGYITSTVPPPPSSQGERDQMTVLNSMSHVHYLCVRYLLSPVCLSRQVAHLQNLAQSLQHVLLFRLLWHVLYLHPVHVCYRACNFSHQSRIADVCILEQLWTWSSRKGQLSNTFSSLCVSQKPQWKTCSCI